jgi:fructose-bisphosphate aldolase class II
MEDKAEFDPRYYLKPARAAMAEVCKARMVSFGQAGNAGGVATKSLDDMKKVYDMAPA